MLRTLVQERRRQSDLAERHDVLSMLLLTRDEAGNGLSDEDIFDELITAVVAGHETTATALAWVFERVLCHPEVERKLRDESESVPLRQVDKLPLLDATIKETLRQRPPLPLVERTLTRSWSTGTQTLPAGVLVAPCLYLTQMRPELYEEPSRFRPERWIAAR